MIDNLIFSISIVLPIFLVMAVGHLAKRKGLIDQEFIHKANKFIFNVALPIKLFGDVARTSFQGAFNIGFIAFAMGATILTTLLAAAVSLAAVKDNSKRGAFIHGAYRGNFLYVGFSIMENMTGSIGTAAPVLVAFVTPLYNVIAVVVLTLASPGENRKIDVRSILLSVLKNPLIIAIALGFASSLAGLSYPLALTRTFSYFSSLATPLALAVIGAAFSFSSLTKDIRSSMVASFLKLVAFPAVVILSAIAIGFSTDEVLALFILFAVPTAATSYIMTSAMGGDEDMATSIIMLTTVLSVLTITAFIFLFKTFSLI